MNMLSLYLFYSLYNVGAAGQVSLLNCLFASFPHHPLSTALLRRWSVYQPMEVFFLYHLARAVTPL